MSSSGQVLKRRMQTLEAHLKQENPVLLSAVQSFRKLDKVAHGLGLLNEGQSYAMLIPWWPLISVLGTFSAGKSTFINHYLQGQLQRTGNQAVDDRFTVMCYSHEATPHALPGIALDSDPRFPFYQMSEEIEKVAEGEGERIDAYLQLKTCPSESLRGKILIDSPGFDADAQRSATLRITDHIIDLSDLVLVLFDARHPEPGAMRDTLDHLVSRTLNRPDTGKFLFILNQIDTTAREDNPEEVVAAWQRALGERGLTAGRFYTIYNPDAATPIDNPELRRRFESKRDADLSEIHGRMHEVEIERAYRIVGALEKNARDIREKVIPELQGLLEQWRTRTLWGDAIAFGALLVGALALTISKGYWQGISFAPPWLEAWSGSQPLMIGTLVGVLIIVLGIHGGVRKLAAKSLMKKARKRGAEINIRGSLIAAFERNTAIWSSVFRRGPAGWGRMARKRVEQVLQDTDTFVQTLNDQFTNPSGKGLADVQHQPKPAPAASDKAEAEPETDPHKRAHAE